MASRSPGAQEHTCRFPSQEKDASANEDRRPTTRKQTYRFPTPLVALSLELIQTAGVSLRGSVRVLDVVQRALNLNWDIPHWTTVRNWLLRVGLARWRAGQQQASDWLFLADHSVQIGTEKCFVGLGIRQAEYQRLNRPLTLEDMTLLQMEVMPRSTKEDVDRSLRRLSQTVGVPRGIVHDEGADLVGGVRLLNKHHPQVRSINDCKHKAACMLKKRLHNDERWKKFQTQLGRTKAEIQQTEMAFLVPPSQRTKARYMNVDRLVVWAEKVLALLAGRVELGTEVMLRPERLEEKLGWLKGYTEELKKWREWLVTIEVVVGHVGRHGLRKAGAEKVEEELGKPRSATELGQELLEFVKGQCKGLKEGERLPGSTEVVETCMGKLKRLEGEQSKGGFTGLLLGLAAVVGKKDTCPVSELFEQASTKDVRAWIKENLGLTVQAARQRLGLAFKKAQQKQNRSALALT